MYIKLGVNLCYIISDVITEWSTFIYVTIEIISTYFVILLPVSFMVYCHHYTYSKQVADNGDEKQE